MSRRIFWLSCLALSSMGTATSLGAESAGNLGAESAAGGRVEPLVCFFDGPRFTGASFCARPGIETRDAQSIRLGGQLNNWDKRICSIQVVGEAKVTVWEGKGFSGPSLLIHRSEHDMRAVRTKGHGVRDWCHAVSSYKVHP